MPSRISPALLQRWFIAAFFFASVCLLIGLRQARRGFNLSSRLERIMSRPIFSESTFAIEFLDLDSGHSVYSLNPGRMVMPGSTVKMLTEGAALAILGPNFRSRTDVIASGTIDASGVLHGSLILRGAEDPSFTKVRFEADPPIDHSAGGPASMENTLGVFHELAVQIKASGIRKVEGSIQVEDRSFAEQATEEGAGTTIAAISVNDNLIDLTVTPGSETGESPSVAVSPQVPGYATVVNRAVTSGPRNSLQVELGQERTPFPKQLIVRGEIPLGSAPVNLIYRVPDPDQLASIALVNALQAVGVKVDSSEGRLACEGPKRAAKEHSSRVVAEHYSPPLYQEVKFTLKVSQNLHAEMTLRALGGIKQDSKPVEAGLAAERQFLIRAGLDPSQLSQSDGSGGDWGDRVTPDFICRYLGYWRRRPDFPNFLRALPVLGQDGTLASVLKDSPAAGHIFAKTGTVTSEDILNRRLNVVAKGLAGYMTTRSGRHLAFAIYANNTSVTGVDQIGSEVGLALAQVAASAYEE